MPRLLWLLTVCLSATLLTPAPAAEPYWPQWRGPDRTGISSDKGLLQTWDGMPPLVWKAEGLGAGFSSITVADGRIYTMGDRDGRMAVVALSLDNGKILWATPIGDVWEPGGYAGPRCSPTIDNDRVYALGTHGDLVCLDATTGEVRWQKSLPKDFGGRMMSGWGYSESPLVDGEKLVCTPGGTEAAIVALNKMTGEEIWRSEIPKLGESGKEGAAYSSIVISNAGGVKQYVQLMGRGLVGIDAQDGRFLWGYNRIANNVANIPTPIVKDDLVFASTGYQTGAALLKLSASGDGVRAEEVYFLEPKTLQIHHGGMILLGDYLYGGKGHNNGFPVCVELATGKIVWEPGRGPGSGSAAVAYADGNLYFRYQNGVMALIQATPEEYQLQGTFKIPSVEKPSWPHPVITGGRLFLREQDSLYCYDVKQK